MFNQYFQMANRIKMHYLSPKVFICLLTGKFVPPINRKNLYSLQYSMLPARRATIREMWRALNEESKSPKKFPMPYIPPLQNGRRAVSGTGRR
ncbi:hypothetical protein BGZ63DRAFT_370279 [Mariannaea sp. PMI_226]|nr:hypothetical protein BGZ63DRAFT_370279 [Mariannaea sp. PMI_226]